MLIELGTLGEKSQFAAFGPLEGNFSDALLPKPC